MRAQRDSIAAGHISEYPWMTARLLPKRAFFETLANKGRVQG
jgi:hypothetical protein